MTFKTTDLCDEFSAVLQVAEPIFTSYGGRRRFFGPIATLEVFEDNTLVRAALGTLPAGTVLVVDGGGSKRCALLGDQLAAMGVVQGLAGVIINGCARDTADLAAMDMGVLALAPCPLRSKKEGKGQRGVVVRFAGIDWTPGHYAYADEDGVVVAPHALSLNAQ